MRRKPLLHRRRSTWQPLFVRALRAALQKPYFRVFAEVQLNQQPLRLDTVVVRRRQVPPGFRPRALGTLMDHLGAHTLIEHKGATDRADWKDLLHLLACAELYCIEEEIQDPEHVRLMVVAPRVTDEFLEQVRRRNGMVSRLDTGVYEVSGLYHRACLIETEDVADQVLHIFSRSFLRSDPAQVAPLLNEDERAIFLELIAEIEQFKARPKLRLQYPDYEEVAMSLEQFMDAILEHVAPEKRLRGLTPKQRLAGLAPDEMVECLTPEQLSRLREILKDRKEN